MKMRSKDFIQNHIFELQQTPVKNPLKLPSESLEFPKVSEPLEPILTNNPSQNATVQRQLYENLQKNKAVLYEYNNLLKTAISSEIRLQFTSKIKELEETVVLEERKLKKLKGNAEAQTRARKKKREKLDKKNIVEMYNKPGQ